MAARLACAAFLFLACASPAAAGNVVKGKILFRHYCGSCHTMKDAGTVAKSGGGPVLTGKSVTTAKVRAVMTGMSAGMMPAFVNKLTATQMNDVVAYVVRYSKPAAK